uniref:Uncharacterized protein n=1 Tax=Anguilla anguilla TaxID=7936 RepID=A0A0E9WLS7_ANGAN
MPACVSRNSKTLALQCHSMKMTTNSKVMTLNFSKASFLKSQILKRNQKQYSWE